MADSFEKQQPVGAKEEETDARLLRLVAWLFGGRTVCKKEEGTTVVFIATYSDEWTHAWLEESKACELFPSWRKFSQFN